MHGPVRRPVRVDVKAVAAPFRSMLDWVGALSRLVRTFDAIKQGLLQHQPASGSYTWLSHIVMLGAVVPCWPLRRLCAKALPGMALLPSHEDG